MQKMWTESKTQKGKYMLKKDTIPTVFNAFVLQNIPEGVYKI